VDQRQAGRCGLQHLEAVLVVLEACAQIWLVKRASGVCGLGAQLARFDHLVGGINGLCFKARFGDCGAERGLSL